MSADHYARAEATRRRRELMDAERAAFYRHYWACPGCGPYRRCDEGRRLQREYTIASLSASILATAGRAQRNDLLAAVPAGLATEVEQRVKQLWQTRQT